MDHAAQTSPKVCALAVPEIKKLKPIVVYHSKYLIGFLIEKEVLLDVDCTSRIEC